MFENTKYGKYVFTTGQPLHTNINRNTKFIKSRKFLKFSPYFWLTRDVDHILILIQVLIRVKISDLI